MFRLRKIQKLFNPTPQQASGHASTVAPPAIIVAFVYQSDRDLVLNSFGHLQGTRIAIRTDLPMKLKKKEGFLASMTYKRRKEKHLKTRMRVLDADVLWKAVSV